MDYIHAFVNDQIFGGIIFDELVIKCFRSFEPSLAMKYWMPTFRNLLFHQKYPIMQEILNFYSISQIQESRLIITSKVNYMRFLM